MRMAYSPQKRITEEGRLLDEKGQLMKHGWSEHPLLGYDRSDVHFLNRLRVKEWDSYSFGNEEWQISVSFADNSSTGVFSASVTNLRNGVSKTAVFTERLPLGGYEMPNTSTFGDIVYRSKVASANITLGQNERRIMIRWPNFDDVRELYITAAFHQPHDDNLSCVIPFRSKSEFLYSHRMFCMPVSALVRLGGIETHFEKETTLGFYCWSRGVFPTKTDWLCFCANSFFEGERFGFYLGEGFGDRRECGENAFFCKGKIYKLGELDITVPSDPDREAWFLIGEDGDINIRMVPQCSDRGSVGGRALSRMSRHRVFGRYYGTVMLRGEDGSVQRLVLDGIQGFCESVSCKW